MVLTAQRFDGGNPLGQRTIQPVSQISSGMIPTVKISFVNDSNHH
jgi:hypothetical protein